MDTSDLAKRMKEYEKAGQRYLTRRMPVIQRYDGCHFHSFTKGFKRPFDELLIKTMQETAKYLCDNIQNAVCAYTESDEITLVLIDYKKINSSAWFDNRQNKMESVGASMCTMAFNKFFRKNVEQYIIDHKEDTDETTAIYIETLKKAVEKGAMFDARCFNIPKEEVTSCIYWRQLDATRNSIQMVGQANFSHKELHGKTCNMIQDMLMTQKGINWNDLPVYLKRGSCCIRNKMISEPYGNRMMTNEVGEGQWFIDKNIPIFKGEDRKYIDDLIFVGEGL